MLDTEPHHIIAIGASAGGMEEINTFFDHTPLDGVCYVIIQHLSSDFKSRMAELLSRHSKLEVKEAEEGEAVRANVVYLIPNNKYMSIHGKCLYLTGKENKQTPHLTVNTFFTALAANSGAQAIGIIFSGLGSDGTEGVRAIKKAGGMVMARNPETTAFAGMPSNAIATGLVDFVLEPELMPHAIEDYIRYGGELLTEKKDDEKTLRAIVDLLKQRSPLDFSDYKQSTILRRTKRRAAFGNFTSLRSYLDFLETAPEELEALAKEFLISVTAFFRDKEAFDYLKKEIIPAMLQQLEEGEELKLWIAGCATGEEVYSLAILICEQLTADQSSVVVKIFATDIDSIALAYAGKGTYSSSITRDVSPERLEKYFIQESGRYRIKADIRRMVIFAQHDLVKNPPYCNMHFISCRNLLIYMTPVLQKKIFGMFLFGLKKGGYLFLGSSENPSPILKNLEVVHKKWKIYKNLESKRAVSFDAFSLPEVQDVKYQPVSSVRERSVKNTGNALDEAIHATLAENLDYLAVCIDANDQVIRSYGDTKYLLPRHFTSNLPELLPKTLALAFNSLRNKVLQTNERSAVNGIKVQIGSEVLKVRLTMSPLPSGKDEQKLLMVSFSEDKQHEYAHEEDTIFDEKLYHDQYTRDLEEEVRELRGRLHSAREQLDATNENMQSFNEELLSANEEMQSTNEEMQSVNEELHTINSDYQLKNKELLEINDDLNNYFRSNINGQLFIDKELRLMKFSPGTVKQINLLETDIGRPISHITTNIKFETILDDIKEVIANGTIITKEIETNDGKWYQVMTMPYVQQSDNEKTGAIVTFNDITVLKGMQQQLDNTNKLLNMAITASGLATWSVNVQTGEFNPSARLKELFGFDAHDTMTYEAAIAQILEEYRPMVNTAVEQNASTGEKYDVEYPVHGFRDGKLRWVKGIGDLSYDAEGKPNYFTGVLNDITIYKQDETRKNDFIAMVSHELRTPLTVFQAYVQFAISKARLSGDLSVVGPLDKANSQAKKMAGMVDGFLNVSSFGAGKIYLTKQSFEINTLLEESVEEARFTTPGHQLVLLPSPPVTVKADPDKIAQVVINLLSNAAKYSPEGTVIEVSCKEINGTIQVSIKDEGMGIRPGDQEKMFDRYHRIENEHTSTISGFGLGLYLCAEIIQRHDGKLWVESEAGKGSTFYFSLPLRK